MRVLITGASGFIGRHLLDVFLEQYEVYATYLKNKGSESHKWVYLDILNTSQVSEVLQKIKPDYLIHTAWYVEHGAFWNSPLNIPHIHGTLHLWKKFIEYGGKKALFLGSGVEKFPFGGSYHCNNVYGQSKIITSKLIEDYGNIPYVWGRIFGVYGPFESLKRFIPYVVNSYLQKEIPFLKNPSVSYDYIYVKTLAKLLRTVLFSDITGICDLGSGQVFSLGEIANLIHKKFFPHLAPPILNENFRKPEVFSGNLEPLQEFIKPMMCFEETIQNYFKL